MSDDARLAASFGGAAAEYERGRPGYPEAAIATLQRKLGLGPDSVVVDLAAGTGKLTRELAGRFGRVVAVEPLEPMLAQLRQTARQAEAVAGSAEAMPMPAASVDAVLAAQAFHWFDGPRALREIGRVLRRGGGLGLLWNTTPWELREGPWFARLDDLLERSRADLSTMRRHGTGRWREAFDATSDWEPLRHASFENPQRFTREDFLAGLASRSYIASLATAERAEVLAGIERLLGDADAPLEDGQVLTPMRTDVYWTRLRR